MIQWNKERINEMVSEAMNASAWKLDQVAQSHIAGEFPTVISFSTPDDLLAEVRVGYEGIVSEYGTADRWPTSWGIKSLMEMSVG